MKSLKLESISTQVLAIWLFSLAILTLSTLLSSSTEASQTATLRKDTPVYEKNFLDARIVGNLKSGEKVDIQELKSSWARITAGKTKGWVRALSLQAGGQANVLSSLSRLESGRSGQGNQMSTTGIRSLPKASRHALIITISDYTAPGISDLKGVKFDADSAKRMAVAMSIPDANIKFLKDSEATRQGMLEAFRDLANRVRQGDRVFVYYSGHGTRWVDAAFDPNSCTEGLLSYEGEILSNREISQTLKPIGQAADKLMVFYDACHSGGIIAEPTRTRAVRLAQTTLTPKFAGSVSPELCAQPTNMKTRSLSGELGRGGVQKDNVVFVAASRPSEVSFDDAQTGGLATQAFRDCLLGEASDLDQSGAISVAEITLCAQKKLDVKLLGQPDILGQKMIIGGNASFVPTFADVPVQVVSLSERPIAGDQPVIMATAPPDLEPAPPESQPGQLKPADLLEEIFRQRDAKRDLKLVADPSKMRIKKDRLGLTVTPSHDGYLYIALAGSDAKSLYLLFPNELDGNNAVKAGQTIQLPSKGWRIRASGPAGVNTVLALVADSPRDLSGLKGEATGPFVKTLFSKEGNSQLQAIFNNSGNADQTICQEGGKTRNLTVERDCSDSFSAALVRIEEIASE